MHRWRRNGGRRWVGRWGTPRLPTTTLLERRPTRPLRELSRRGRQATCSTPIDAHDSVLPALVAITQLKAARQNLKAIAALLPLDDAELPILGAARACCEASARAAAVVDPNASPIERFTRALNESWHVLSTIRKDAATPAHQAVVDFAEHVGIPVKLTKRGTVAHFGDKPRPSMTAVSSEHLASVDDA